MTDAGTLAKIRQLAADYPEVSTQRALLQICSRADVTRGGRGSVTKARAIKLTADNSRPGRHPVSGLNSAKDRRDAGPTRWVAPFARFSVRMVTAQRFAAYALRRSFLPAHHCSIFALASFSALVNALPMRCFTKYTCATFTRSVLATWAGDSSFTSNR
jgi:hypothetical protein